jgi:hypothetical protein
MLLDASHTTEVSNFESSSWCPTLHHTFEVIDHANTDAAVAAPRNAQYHRRWVVARWPSMLQESETDCRRPQVGSSGWRNKIGLGPSLGKKESMK